MKNLRIISLLPAATEMVFLLGLEKYLVGVSHECDFPEEVKFLPKITSSAISNALSSKEINEKVAQMQHRGSSVFHIDGELLRKLAPTVILTQELCEVCAISWSEVKKAAKILDGESRIISLEPETVEDVLENILLIGEVTGRNMKARRVVDELRARLINCDLQFEERPKVLIIEWLEPLMSAGHWVPEMVEKAGGKAVKIYSGHKSYPISIDQVIAAAPQVVIFAPCGFNIERTLREKYLIENLIKAIGIEKAKYFLMDGNAYLTRPGPRIINGIEILGEILHPKLFSRKYREEDWQRLSGL